MLFKFYLSVVFCSCITFVNAQFDNSKFNLPATSSGSSNLKISPNQGAIINQPNLPQLQFESNQFETAVQNTLKEKQQQKAAEDLKNKGIITKEDIYKQLLKKQTAEFNTRYFPKVDQDLGSLNTNSKEVTIVCRDYQYPDGDAISIFLNDNALVRNIILTENSQRFTIPLTIGMNVIAFKALNQGSSGPNTAAFSIYDENGKVLSSSEWNLATDAKAYFSIARDQ